MNLLAALIYILVGLLNCFVGLRLFRIVLVVVGFLIGFVIGASLTADLGQVTALVIGIVGGLVGALLGYLLYPIGIVIAGAALGVGIAALIGQAFSADDTTVLALVLIGGVLGAVIGLALSKPIIMISTAILGAQSIMTGVLLIFGVGEVAAQTVFSYSAISLIGTVILAILGFVYQYRDQASLK